MAEGLRPGIDFVGVAANFICHDGNEFLLHKKGAKSRDGVGTWEFGAGQLDRGETIERGVLRELEEEHGVVGRIEEQWAAYTLLRDSSGKLSSETGLRVVSSWLIVPFLIAVSKSNIDNTSEPGKIAERKFFTLDQLPQPLHPGAEVVLSKCQKQFDVFRGNKL